MDSNEKKDPIAPANQGIDLGNILLPNKKAGPDPVSSTRAPAGALLAQEQSAELPKPPKPATTPAPPPPTPQETQLKSLQTFRGDIESVVEDKKLSAISIAATEADAKKSSTETSDQSTLIRTLGYILGGVVLITLALATIAWVSSRPTSVPGVQEPVAPFIAVDEATPVAFESLPTRGALMTALNNARKNVQLSLGLVAWLYTTIPSSGEPPVRQLSASELIQILAPQAPNDLLRVLRPTYLIGVHSFDENQALLLLSVDAYEVAYAGMIGWERTMEDDLAPLFVRKVSPQITSIEPASSTTSAVAEDTRFIQTRFVDKVVENRDTRALLAPDGQIKLLWTFIGRNTILITTNEYTLREVISRTNLAPVVPTGQ